jgi:anti-sigma B factor antagonist
VINVPDPTHWGGKPLSDEPGVNAVEPGFTAAVGARPGVSPARDAPQRPWGLSVQHYPAAGMCVVVVEGELELRTAPLLEHRVREQFLAAPVHLILDLEPLHFLGSDGLNCLLRVRELAQTSGVQLHLAGLVTPAVARVLEITGLLTVFHTYPTLIHAVMELADHPATTRSEYGVLPPVLTAFWRCLAGSTWILELREFGVGLGGAVVDWINSGVPATQPAPDTAEKLLTVNGLWLYRDPTVRSATGGRHGIGYVCADIELIMLADLMRDEAAQARLHPIMLAAWVAAGYSTTTAAGWIRAGCLFPS